MLQRSISRRFSGSADSPQIALSSRWLYASRIMWDRETSWWLRNTWDGEITSRFSNWRRRVTSVWLHV